MTVYALFPLIATAAYMPLLLTALGSRPWQHRHTLFVLFLLSAMLWSLTDYFYRGNFFPEHNYTLFKIIIIVFSLMCVQLHAFASTYYTPRQNRWLPFAYISLAIIIVLVLLGYMTKGVVVKGDVVHGSYSIGILFMMVTLLTVAGRSIILFSKRLRTLNNPVLYNQILSLLLGISVVVVFSLSAFLPWTRDYPTSHIGNLINAVILSYATVRHQLVDIKIVLRRGFVFVTLLAIGAVVYWMVLVILHNTFGLVFEPATAFLATVIAIVIAISLQRLRNWLTNATSRFFQGQTFNYRRSLSDFINKIHNIFSLKEQGSELLKLVTGAVGCSKACLLFPEVEGQDFTAQLLEPREDDNPLAALKLRADSPIVEYLSRERKLLTRENLEIQPEFRGLWQKEKDAFGNAQIEIFVPLISRERLIAIMVLDKKRTGRYSLEDLNLIETVSQQVAVSMEKEYLREQLKEREEELSVINRLSAIITSSLDIQGIFDSFITELKKVVDVNWSSVMLIEENTLYRLAQSPVITSIWQVGEQMPMKGTGTEWVAAHKATVYEPDLKQETRFVTGKKHIEQNLRSIIYLPLMAKGEVTGTLIVASQKPNAYTPRKIALLEQLAAQIAMPAENARLYAKVEEKARVDELTGLFNRRSLDEAIAQEIGRHSRYGGVFSIIIMDLDSFKAYNDKFGHPAGDKLLRQIGTIIKGAIRSADIAFRYGGDEFAILMPQTAIDAASQVAERVRQHVATKAKMDSVQITASLGLASWPADGIGPNEMIAAADASLYRAKRNGGNQYVCSSGTLLHLGDLEVSFWSDNDSGTLSAIYALAATVDARDHYTGSHSKRVSKYAVALGEALGLKPMQISNLETSALLHDIGKIGISDEILGKNAGLTDNEWEIVKTHPRLGATIAGRSRQLAAFVPGILHHHERFDGTGYPQKLKGEDIPLEARILAIADSFAAMTSERAYSTALTMNNAMEELRAGAGTQFDPRLVEIFATIVPKLAQQPRDSEQEVT
ncbi:MAG: diguanylate cyclase [Dehalococcoidales bacterium]|nr:diguanylate cyclase [Dehalococcoidales bacterium]